MGDGNESELLVGGELLESNTPGMVLYFDDFVGRPLDVVSGLSGLLKQLLVLGFRTGVCGSKDISRNEFAIGSMMNSLVLL